MIFNDLATAQITRKDIDYVCDRASGRIWILHGKPIFRKSDPTAVQFERLSGKITFFADNDELCAIPVPVKDPLTASFANADFVTVVWTDKGEIHDLHILPIKSV